MRHLIAFSLAAGLALATTLATFPEQAQAAANHGLNAGQINKIRSLGLKVVVPGYLPAGFKLSKFDSGMDEMGNDQKSPYYHIAYVGPKNQSFYLCGGETCSWGADNEGAQSRKTLNHALFSRLTLFRYVFENRVSYNTAHEMSLKAGGKYEYGSPDNPESGQSALPEAENVKVLNGLRLL